LQLKKYLFKPTFVFAITMKQKGNNEEVDR
jgi:hypothetical protein